MSDKIRVLIADDSAITRNIFEKAFSQAGFEVVALVSNARKALDYCRENPVDIVVSDYDMPEMDGIQGCKMITKEFSIPVVIYADDMSIKDEALKAGAVFFVKKPSLSSFNDETMQTFTLKVKGVINKSSSARPHRHEKKLPEKEHIFPADHSSEGDEGSDLKNIAKRDFKVLCIGASTGGPTAVQTVLSGLGENFPLPILYTQHLDVGSDEKMARWFCDTCPNVQTSLAKDGEIAEAGHVYLAPADRHLVIDYVRNGRPVLHLSDEPPERFLRPAVNKLFRSAAKIYKEECLAVLMTGMGSDGAEGCKEIIENSGYTICESKSTCTVFGMPAAAIELGAASRVLPRTSIARAILSMVR